MRGEGYGRCGGNAGDLTAIEGVSLANAADGYAIFEEATRTIKLKNVRMVAPAGKKGISCNGEPVAVEVEGANECSADEEALVLATKCTIRGAGSLSLVGGWKGGLIFDHPLTISQCELSVQGGGAGIRGTFDPPGDSQKIILQDGAILRAKGTSGPSMEQISSIDMDGYGFSVEKLSRIYLDEDTHAVCTYGDTPVKGKWVAIAPYFGLLLCGNPVTMANCEDLLKMDGVSAKNAGGYARYDPVSKVLSMKDVRIEEGSYSGIICHISAVTGNQRFTLSVSGDVELAMDGATDPALKLYATTIIRGPGRLSITGGYYGIDYVEALRIENVDVVMKPSNDFQAIMGGGELHVFHSSLSLESSPGEQVLKNVDKLSLEACAITSPTGARFDAGQKTLVDEGGAPIAGQKVLIGEVQVYPLWVVGRQVGELNRDDLTQIPGVSTASGDGYARYDPASLTLSLKDVKISSSAASGLISRVPKEGGRVFTIALEGENSVRSQHPTKNYDGLELQEETSIRGSGSLGVNAASAGLLFAKPVEISECSLSLRGMKFGLVGLHKTVNPSQTLRIDHAEVSAMGGEESMAGFYSFGLAACEIVEPGKAHYDEGEHAVVGDDGQLVKGVPVRIARLTLVTGVSLDLGEKSLRVGETFTLAAEVEPADADNKTIGWSSSDETVATVADGMVTAVSAGVAMITVTTEDGQKMASCEVSVVASGTGGNSGTGGGSGSGGGSGAGGGSGTGGGGSAPGIVTPVVATVGPVLSLSPNLVCDRLYVLGLDNPVRVEIFNITGSRCLSADTDGFVDVSGLPSGVFYVRIAGQVLRFVKQ
ncbi:MAG: hypothetical protein CSA97_03790 [Bacteroidetes bacterium]|nr:MAG: hypothetical protein CSA97_03790 [Bacteroidota bacterium]